MSKNTPEIRIKGFEDSWKQHKLGEVVNVYDGVHQTPDYKESGVMFLSVENINTLKSEKYISEEAFYRDYKVYPQKGDVLMTRIGDVGTPNVVETVEKVAFYVSLALLKPINVNSYFLCNAIQSPLFKSGLKDRTLVTAIPQKINKDEIGKVDIILPVSTREQKLVGEYFKNLDHIITLHQQEYDKLVNNKKAMLEKMFPKEGCDVPEIRFKGFDKPWEKRELTNIYQKIRNAFVGTATPYYVDDGHFYLESNNIKNGQINRKSEIFINDEFYEKQKDNWLHTDDLVMVQSGHVGHTAVIPKSLNNTAAHALIIIANPKEDTDPHFINYQFQSPLAKQGIDCITTGNTIKHILASEMKRFEILIPCYAEQKKIGNYFKELDNLISYHQQELEKLKNIKAALLEKMFV